VPHPRGPVQARGDHARAVGAERGAQHLGLVLEVAGHRLAGRRVPTRAVLSKLAVTTRVPSGLNAALTTLSWCTSALVNSLPVAASHNRACRRAARATRGSLLGDTHRSQIKRITSPSEGRRTGPAATSAGTNP